MCVAILTCWSTPTASRPSYMMLTQPSLHDRTNSDISAWNNRTHTCISVMLSCRIHIYVSAPDVQYCVDTDLSQIVEVVFASDPSVPCLQTLGFIGDVGHIVPLALEELPLKQLHTDTCVCTERRHMRTVCPLGNYKQINRCTFVQHHNEQWRILTAGSLEVTPLTAVRGWWRTGGNRISFMDEWLTVVGLGLQY